MKINIANMDAASGSDAAPADGLICGRCESGSLGPKRIKTAFWHDAGLAVIRDIPAMVCTRCGEEYVGDTAVLGLDRMRGNGFSGEAAVTRMTVPVFDYVDPGTGES